MKPRLHVIGAGLAGLAAAWAACRAGTQVVLYESTGQAGGRCRSFTDPLLNRMIDNGSHLVLGINTSVLKLGQSVGATLSPLPPALDFLDMADGRRWRVGPFNLPVGWGEILAALMPHGDKSVAQTLGQTKGFRHFWNPLCLAVLNTRAEQASATVMARVLRALLKAGPAGFQGYAFPKGLSADLVEPILNQLRRNGALIRFHHRLTAISQHRLTFGQCIENIEDGDKVVLALPPWIIDSVLASGYCLPTETIANLHFLLPLPVSLPGPLGLVGARSHWLFVRGDIASVTISAAALPIDAAEIWGEIAPVLACPSALPPHRVIVEKRATLRHDAQSLTRRPGPTTPLPGVFLAGDWLASPWPCTLESAVSSGLTAARLALGRDDLRFS